MQLKGYLDKKNSSAHPGAYATVPAANVIDFLQIEAFDSKFKWIDVVINRYTMMRGRPCLVSDRCSQLKTAQGKGSKHGRARVTQGQ
jgi:hypothetical protein